MQLCHIALTLRKQWCNMVEKGNKNKEGGRRERRERLHKEKASRKH